MSTLGHIAAIRYGLGLRLGEDSPPQPRDWLLGQIDQPAPPPDGPGLGEALAVRNADLVARRPRDPQGDPQQARAAIGALLRQETEGWAARRLEAAQPFRERLVDFWMNHFTVSRRSGSIAVLIGSYERDAIRPHVTGRFADMVVAVARHPAMLIYLDNAGSIGPASPAGLRSRRGLNENLAREMLELHTLSPAGGYTQNDVQELAKILTGWSFVAEGDAPGFQFRRFTHEPGEKFLLGRRFGPGEAAGEAALRMLAEHPATWRHLAVKLARHFVADTPPPEAVRALETVLRDSQGDLAATSRALVALPQAWDPPLTKLRAPVDYVLAASRALGLNARQARQVLGGMASLGQPLWIAPQPIGWPDIAAEWATPEALMRRIDWAFTLAGTLAGRMERVDGMAAAEAALGPLGRAETAREMGRAGSMRDSLTLLLGSPEFMRR